MEKSALAELLAEKNEQQSPMAKIVRESETEFTVNDHKYEIDRQFLDAFDFEDFRQRYNPAFSQYDYIVGDYSYDQLRMKGFFEVDRANVQGPFANEITDYVLELVNFGAKYFVVHNLEARPITRRNNSGHQDGSKRKRSNNSKNNRRRNSQKNGYVKQKTTAKKAPINKRKNVTVTQEKKSSNKHKFVIKENKD
ncbi:YutD family protein [Lentilactobacillus sp. SPB1-3]|uniref:YutD family protein n=1 Tax=Lentilactobacillus terminaliae TaxID=3003483 RepID=A0ACD5DD56_9LACO|nr:YutD family protein [Lentilactobacillus sp. SPB1-3]MCZ0977333.1 YutD family protein [Lentilactobacillus sp. SPB1-3]